MFEVLGILFGTASIVPIFRFTNENELTEREKKYYPVLGFVSLFLCMLATITASSLRGY